MKAYFFIAAGIFLAGCVSDPGVALTKHHIETISVEFDLKKIPASRFSEASHDLSGQAASALSTLIHRKEINSLVGEMTTNKIEFPLMVSSNVVHTLEQRGYRCVQGPSDATLVFEIKQWGFDESSPFSATRLPFVVIEAGLRLPEGKVIWRGWSNKPDKPTLRTFAFGPLASVPDKRKNGIGVTEWADYYDYPEKLREDWERIVQIAVEDMLSAANWKG